MEIHPVLSSTIQRKLSSRKVHCSISGKCQSNATMLLFQKTNKLQLRYKSLSSLQLTPDSTSTTPISIPPKCQEKSHQLTKSASTQCAREGTLDSSRSGGRTSGDSKLPEKKTRRLSRPRSLSNLVWELRPQKEKSKKKLYVHHYDHHQQGTLYL